MPGGLSYFWHLGDFGCLRSLRYPVPVVAWLQGGSSVVGSRALPFVRFGRWRVCVPASPAVPPQLENPDVCLPPGSVSPQLRGLFFGSSGLGGCPAVRQPGEISAETIRVPGSQSFPRPGHLAFRRLVVGRRSVSPSGSLPLRLCRNGAVSLFLGRWTLWVLVPGARLSIRVCDSGKPPSCLAVGCPAVCPSGCPTLAPLGSAQQSNFR